MRRLVTAARRGARRAAAHFWEPWRDFWFKPADPTGLAVMRILFGGMLFYTHLVWGLNLDGFFGPRGWQGDALVRAVQQGQMAWSFWWWVPDDLRMTVHLVSLGILLLFMLGAFTPVTSVLAWAITVSYAYRAPMANYGLDQINGIAILYLAIGPSGAALSLDRAWHRWRAARRAAPAAEPPPGSNFGDSKRILGATGGSFGPPVAPNQRVRPSARANLALRLIQVHLCVIYLFACHSKLQGDSWWNGEAIWQAISNKEYQTVDLTWLAWYPWLVSLLTHGTIVWEMTFWALVWRPLCRPFVLLTGVAIHLGIGAFMGMWTFGLAVIFLYVAFVPGTSISAAIDGVTGAFGRIRQRKPKAVSGATPTPRLSSPKSAPRGRAMPLDPQDTPTQSRGRGTQQLDFDLPIEADQPAADELEPVPAADSRLEERSTPSLPLPGISPPEVTLEAILTAGGIDPQEADRRPAAAITSTPPGSNGSARYHVEAKKPPAAEPRDAAVPGAPRPAMGGQPVVVLVESRLKRQTQIQEYLVRRHFRCFVASDLHQARSYLSVLDVDALVVTTTWFSDDDLCAFRDALIAGGPSLPASLFFITATSASARHQFQEHARHRLVRKAVSLRELRLLILEILGRSEQPPASRGNGSPHAANGNGHKPQPASDAADLADDSVEESAADPTESTFDPTAKGSER